MSRDPVRIVLLNASHDDANTTRNFRRELEGSIAEFDVTAGRLPEGYEFDAVVVTGSRSSVYWDESWIDATREWVAGAVERDLPCLGICWGHQLLADVLGGEVRDMGAYEIGYREVEHSGDSRLFEGIDERVTAFTTHADEVATLPPGATPIAANDYSNHGFRKDRVFGVQFHPEYDRRTARELTEEKELPEDRREAVLSGITEENYRDACEAKLVFENFLEYVRSTDPDGTAGEEEGAGCGGSDDVIPGAGEDAVADDGEDAVVDDGEEAVADDGTDASA